LGEEVAVVAARLYELSVYLRQLLWRHPPPEGRFAILSHPRSGSQLLRGLINHHPQVCCMGEVFLRFLDTRWSRVLFPRFYLEALAARSPFPTYGCILRQSHLHRVCHDAEAFQRRLAEEGWKLIYLQRADRVRLALSQLRAARLKVWHLHAPEAPVAVRIDVQELRDQLRWIDQVRRHEERIMGSLPHLRVHYEDDLLPAERHQPTADRVFAWLGLPSVPVRARLHRTTPDDLSLGVANWAEVRAALEGMQEL